ncbi:MAG TPA: MarR family winged helix-turn-helix transcriptional regulator [Beijerinckiaceae bacterium]|nr:MarR family winged helix-turn-helix transcriptional regulator [Beijerinckiaceae bacterium]
MSTGTGEWLQRAARRHRQRLTVAFEGLGFFPGQEGLVLHLAENGAMTIGALAEVLKVRPPTVSKTVNRLLAQGLIERNSIAEDARKSSVALTPEGIKRAKVLAGRLDKVEADIADALDDKTHRRLRKGLKKLTNALSPADQDSAEADDTDGDED